jgi:aryl-alcohol dehydrogenase-like predicted oxidoreductase
LASTDVSTLITGISKIDQLDQNVKALEIYAKWDQALEDNIEAFSNLARAKG